jgi:hypothetical protein
LAEVAVRVADLEVLQAADSVDLEAVADLEAVEPAVIGKCSFGVYRNLMLILIPIFSVTSFK